MISHRSVAMGTPRYATKHSPWPADRLARAFDWLRSRCGAFGVDRSVLLHDGAVVCAGNDAELPVENIYSVTKSVTSSLAGVLMEEARFGLDTPLARVEPLLAPSYPTATLRHFLTMTSGYDAAGENRWGEASADWSVTPFAATTPLFRPGTRYCYWDEATIMLARVLTRLAGRRLDEVLHERIFGPLGVPREGWSWWAENEVDGHAICHGGTGLRLSAAALARYGQLWLERGRWRGAQLMPNEYVQNATRVQVSAQVPVADTDRRTMRGSGIYGFLWWIGGVTPPEPAPQAMPHAPVGTFAGWGLRHNALVVVPEWRMVFVRLGPDADPPEGKGTLYDEFLARLGPPEARAL